MAKNPKVIVGLVGVGAMGYPIALNILQNRRFFELVAYDVRDERLELIRRRGATAANSLVDLADKARVIITLLPDRKALNRAFNGRNGVLHCIRKGQTIIEMSTVDPKTTVRIARAVEDRGGSYIDAPIGGTPDMVEGRRAEILASGEKKIVRKWHRLLNSISDHVVYVGGVGSGKTLKLAVNLLIAANKVALAESICFALSSGIEGSIILDVIKNSNANSVVFERYGRAVVNLAREKKISRKHSWQLKDLRLVLREANSSSISLPFGKITERITSDASVAFSGAENYESIVRYYKERLMNVKK